MAELLVRSTDSINDDFYLNTKCTKRGDVIVACPDGWNWGTLELTHSFWRIVLAPAMTLAQAQSFLDGEKDIDPLHPSKTLQIRAVKFNLDDPAHPQPFKDYIADDTRVAPMIKLVEASPKVGETALPVTAIMAAKIVKPPIVDPGIIKTAQVL